MRKFWSISEESGIEERGWVASSYSFEWDEEEDGQKWRQKHDKQSRKKDMEEEERLLVLLQTVPRKMGRAVD